VALPNLRPLKLTLKRSPRRFRADVHAGVKLRRHRRPRRVRPVKIAGVLLLKDADAAGAADVADAGASKA